MPDSPCLILLSETAGEATLAAALEAAHGAGELFALLPDHLSPPEDLPALVASQVAPPYLAQLRVATVAALRPKLVIGDQASLDFLAPAFHPSINRPDTRCVE